jgi:hypothetical protein
MDDAIANFVGITGANETAARQVLEMCAGDLGQAVQLWFNDEELQRNLSNPRPAGASSSTAPPIPHSTRPLRTGREDASGVIHIDSDDDDDEIQVLPDDDVMDFDDDGAAAEAATIARTAQEEEDAAMAKRLQEELYQGQAVDEDGVRAPMARTTETLVAPSGGWGMGVVDDDDDANAAVMEQLRRRREQQGEAWIQSMRVRS